MIRPPPNRWNWDWWNSEHIEKKTVEGSRWSSFSGSMPLWAPTKSGRSSLENTGFCFGIFWVSSSVGKSQSRPWPYTVNRLIYYYHHQSLSSFYDTSCFISKNTDKVRMTRETKLLNICFHHDRVVVILQCTYFGCLLMAGWGPYAYFRAQEESRSNPQTDQPMNGVSMQRLNQRSMPRNIVENRLNSSFDDMESGIR